jgi:hypothetical protein
LKTEKNHTALAVEGGVVAKQHIEKFINGTTLTIPLSKGMRISFDPMNAFDLEEHGTVYPGSSHVSDQWGVLESTGDILLSKNWSFIKLPGPFFINDQEIKGDSWQLLLNPQWMIDSSNGNNKIVEKI